MSRKAVPCPGCGLFVVLHPEANIIRHENPMCDEFKRRVEAAGLKAKPDPWAVVVDPLSGTVKEPAKA